MATSKYSRYYTYIKPVAQNKFIRSFAPYIFSLLTIIFLVIFAIKPTISTILNLQKSIDENKQVLKQLNDKADSLTLGKRNLQALGPETLNKINTLLPSQANVTTIITSLQKVPLGNQASISALQVQPVNLIDNTIDIQKARLNLAEVEFTYNVQSSFQGLLATLQNLSKSPRLININNIVLSKQIDNPMVLSITGKAYFLK